MGSLSTCLPSLTPVLPSAAGSLRTGLCSGCHRVPSSQQRPDPREVLRRPSLNESVSAWARLPCRLPKIQQKVAEKIPSYKMSPNVNTDISVGAVAESQPGSPRARWGSSEPRERPGGLVPRSTQPDSDHVRSQVPLLHRTSFTAVLMSGSM